ncbi:MAG: 50S ribosomal protein L5 [bacterium]|nr:50S ribosomal protein L5 [bacterium]
MTRLQKIVLNIGFDSASGKGETLALLTEQLTRISGQKPIERRAKKAIAAFKTREGDVIGLKVTLRGIRMRDFFSKLTAIVLPRIRDFRGVSTSGFDVQGNYTLGIQDYTIFPEVEYKKSERGRGLEMTIVTTAENPSEARAFFTKQGLPFAKTEV